MFCRNNVVTVKTDGGKLLIDNGATNCKVIAEVASGVFSSPSAYPTIVTCAAPAFAPCTSNCAPRTEAAPFSTASSDAVKLIPVQPEIEMFAAVIVSPVFHLRSGLAKLALTESKTVTVKATLNGCVNANASLLRRSSTRMVSFAVAASVKVPRTSPSLAIAKPPSPPAIS